MPENLLTKRIKNWAKTALKTHFVLGNYIPMDGINGTQKIPAEFFSVLNNLSISSTDEYVFAVLDANNAFLLGVRNDGSIDWAKGIPDVIQKELSLIFQTLADKVDKIDGKGLVNSEFANGVNVVSNDDYILAFLDSNDSLLFGVQKDGTFEWSKTPDFLASALRFIDFSLLQKVDKVDGESLIDEFVAKSLKFQSTDEYVYAVLDKNDSVLIGVNREGKIEIPSFVGGKLISAEYADSVKSIFNEEFAYLFMGADNSVLFGIRKDGRIVSDAIFAEVDKKIKGIDAVNAEYVNNAVESERTRAEAAEQGLQHAIDSINPVIVEGGSNTPDNIFLTEENGAITLKGTSNLLYGLNIKFVPQGASLSSELTDQNTVYVLRFDYNLNGTVEVPENCVLLFEGGSVYNGTLKGSCTKIIYRGAFLASNAVVSGTWNVQRISSDMLVDKTSENSLLKLIPFMSDNCFNEFVVESGNFILDAREESDRLINLCSNTLVRIDGNVTMKPNGYTHYNMIFAENKNNIEITGAGFVSGDADEHDYTTVQSTHEWCMCIELRNCKKVSIHDIVLKNAPGDGIELAGENIEIKNVEIQHCGRQGISVLSAENVIIENLTVDDIYRTAPKAAIDIEPYNGEIAKNVFVRNVNMSNCAGVQVLYCDGVSIENVDSANCDILFMGTDAKNVYINRVKYRGDSIVSSNFFKFDSGCVGVSVDDFDVDSEEAATFNVNNVFTGLKMNLGPNITVSGNPDKGTIKEDSGKYIFFNGTSWVNMDGTSL